MNNFDDLLDAATMNEDELPLCLNGKIRAQYEKLSRKVGEREAELAQEGKAATVNPGDTRMGSKGKGGKTAEDLADEAELARLVEEMKKYTEIFTVRAMPSHDWDALLLAHPPRIEKGGTVHKNDGMGINSATFYRALMRVSVVSPEMTPERWDKLDAKLSSIQFDKLATKCWNVNRAENDLPFSLAELRQVQSS